MVAGAVAADGASVTLHHPDAELTVAADALPVGLLLADARGDVLAVNQAWTELSGLSVEQSVGSGWLRGLDADAGAHIRERVASLASTTARWVTADARLDTGTGPRWTRWQLGRGAHPSAAVIMTVTDIDDDRDARVRLEHQASHDPLTDVVNRAHLFDLTARALGEHRWPHGHVAMLYLDLDRFKDVNDTFGHGTGDRVLAAIAQVVRDAVRPNDVVARVGGDEFAVLCTQLQDPGDAHAIADRIHRALIPPITVGNVTWPIGASIGVAFADASDDSAEALLDRADRAMYQAKSCPPPQRRGSAAGPAGRLRLHREQPASSVPIGVPTASSADAEPSTDGVPAARAQGAARTATTALAITRRDHVLVVSPGPVLDDASLAELNAVLEAQPDSPVVVDLTNTREADGPRLDLLDPARWHRPPDSTCVACAHPDLRAWLTGAGLTERLASFHSVDDAIQSLILAGDGYGPGWRREQGRTG